LKWRDCSTDWDRLNFRPVLDCASPLALWEPHTPEKKRQRAGAVQDAGARAQGRGDLWLQFLAKGRGWLLVAAVLQSQGNLVACGPDFPNSLLDGGDGAVQVAPVADFFGELQRMKLVQTRFQAVPVGGKDDQAGFASQAAATELGDLAAALEQAKVPDDEAEKIRSVHQAAREKLSKFVADTESWENSRPWLNDEKGGHRGQPRLPEPRFPDIAIPAGLPDEFADYVEGALAWHNPAVVGKGMACAAWQRLLDRPPQERRFKSTWAAYMLGKACEEKEPDKAVAYYQQVRDLARHGFVDSVGLAAASLGLEARVYLHQKKYEHAIETYLEQLATDDPTAGPSLVLAAREVLTKGPDVLRPLAVNPRTQRVITAFVISRGIQQWLGYGAEDSTESSRPLRRADVGRAWLEAVAAAGVNDVESAAKLALAAYQNGDLPLAWRWIRRAPSSPVAQWLQAKLLLHDGKTAQAAALLASVARSFPIEPPSTNRVAGAQFEDLLSMRAPGYYVDGIPAERQVLGELGVLRLARREYTQALDALLNAGFWMDAAYVAERVLTLEELKAYVDGYWPPVPPEQVAEENEKYGQSEISPALLRTQIRYLLARRLMRAQRSAEAGEYYPAEWTAQYLALVQFLRTGWDVSLAADERAKALFQAAVIMRTNGMELVGTEVEPDWHVHGGNYEEGVTVGIRGTNEAAKVLVASKDELSRGAQHKPDPEERFHYRYQAASLAWEAATLMPDNSEETARVLCTAGSWLKRRDPETADYFYKALVRRNRKTAIGMEADRIRWFPRLDEEGNLIPRQPSRLESMEPPALPEPSSEPPSDTEADEVAREYPVPGKSYAIHSGDELRDIARAASVFGQLITVEEILKANPGLDAGRVQVGQKILVPGPKLDNPESVPDAPADPVTPETPTAGPMPTPDSPP
jgi:tetratricopeptide (TPR) repeat protein